jgi:uncharacterized protein YfaS (alpha-2-macroglobulin family)
MLEVSVGENMWPELGERIEYLMRYPHGCVEQTTSSTLPLLAARKIFPRIGANRHPDAFYRKRIQAGLSRLGTMQTASGGLAYWPGRSEPNVYGTAYAMRAFALARQAKMEPPSKVMKGMTAYLRRQVLKDGTDVDLRALIAFSLGEVDALPPGILDTLYAQRDEMSLFSKASLALALTTSDLQRDRVATVLDSIEKGFDGEGDIVSIREAFGSYGSPQRTRAMVVAALTKLRPESKLLPLLLRRVVRAPRHYTTQSTAYSLLALADHLEATDTGKGDVEVLLDGEPLAVHEKLEVGGKRFVVPLSSLRGKKRTLTLRAPGAVGFLIRASYRRPIREEQGELLAASAKNGPDLHRMFTTPSGGSLDMRDIRAGQLVRVALFVQIPRNANIHRDYVAITDRLPAGFEPVQPDLATVASAPDVTSDHPLYRHLRYQSAAASHVELRDDRVQVYFDKVPRYARHVVATYLARATTPGTFALPPASVELMYEPGSTSYSAGGNIRIRARKTP